MNEEKILIEHLGKSFYTKHYDSSLTDSDCEDIRNEYFAKPPMIKIIKELEGLAKQRTATTNINRYYVNDLMAKVLVHYNKWTIEEAFQSNDIIRFMVAKTQINKDVYLDTQSREEKIRRVIQLGTKGVTSAVPNYPVKSVKDILDKYDVNGNYYDYSCGWGARMLGSLASNINYHGTDPNYLLTERLHELSALYKEVNYSDTTVDIRTQGSEVFVPEWKNKMGIAFSSPPYFALEDYRIGEGQSVKEDTSYQDWLDGYWTGTVKNIHKYLVDDDVLLVNINDYGKYALVADTRKICEDNGFVMVDTEQLSNISRIRRDGGLTENDEDIMVFRKKGFENVKPKSKNTFDDLFF